MGSPGTSSLRRVLCRRFGSLRTARRAASPATAGPLSNTQRPYERQQVALGNECNFCSASIGNSAKSTSDVGQSSRVQERDTDDEPMNWRLRPLRACVRPPMNVRMSSMWTTMRRLARRSMAQNRHGRTSSPTQSNGVHIVIPETSFVGSGGLVTVYDRAKGRMITRESDSKPHPRTIFVWDEEPVALTADDDYGYAPFALGQRVPTPDGKELEIVGKLGWGRNSSVWLTKLHDEDANGRYRHYYAYKVLTASASQLLFDGVSSEKEVLLAITHNRDRPGAEFCDMCYVWVPVETLQGSHAGFVLPVHGSNLSTLALSQPGRKFTSEVTRHVVKQLLQALDFLHTTCEVIHTDVKPANIFVKIKRSDRLIEKHLQRFPPTAYPSKFEPAISPNPIETVCSQPMPNFGLSPSLDNLSVCLGDFGNAVFAQDDLTYTVQPQQMRSPESLLGHPWSTPVDIWSIGCLVFEMLVGGSAFPPPPIEGFEADPYEEGYLQLLCAQHGVESFTPDFISRCTRREPYFDDNGAPRFTPCVQPISIEERLRVARYNEGDLSEAARFIERCLTINPNERPSAAQLLQHDWLKSGNE